MIALLYNDTNGGMHEYEFRMANSTEVRLGLKYMVSHENIFTRSSVLSPNAYSPDGLMVLYLDQMSPTSRFATAAALSPPRACSPTAASRSTPVASAWPSPVTGRA